MTGGAGFIGSHFTHRAVERHDDWQVTVLDKLTYAGNPANLEDLEGHARYRFRRGDIAVRRDVEAAWGDGVDLLFNFAAETHVDRSIGDAEGFIRIAKRVMPRREVTVDAGIEASLRATHARLAR